jgi:hypothetical protein
MPNVTLKADNILMEGIVDHKTDGHAVESADIYTKHGSNRQVRKKTKGWQLCVEWKYGTTSWERLADLKESNPVEVDEYDAVGILLWCVELGCIDIITEV